MCFLLVLDTFGPSSEFFDFIIKFQHLDYGWTAMLLYAEQYFQQTKYCCSLDTKIVFISGGKSNRTYFHLYVYAFLVYRKCIRILKLMASSMKKHTVSFISHFDTIPYVETSYFLPASLTLFGSFF